MTNTRLLALLLPLSLAACTDEAKDEGTPEGADGASDGADGADGTADGAPSNSPPTTATVALSPERPTTDQDATVVIVAGASDPDGDGLTYRYVWFQDGVLRADLTTDTPSSTGFAHLCRRSARVEERQQVVDGEASGAEDGPERARGEWLVRRDRQRRPTWGAERDVGALLAHRKVAHPPQGSDQLV